MRPEEIALTAYLRHQVRAALNVEGVSLRDLAIAVGVSHPAIKGIRDGTNALGERETAGKLITWLKLPTMAAAYEAAAAFAEKNPTALEEEGHISGDAPRPVAPPDPDDEFPERAAALRAAVVMGYAGEAVANVRSMAMLNGERLSREDWLGLVRSESLRTAGVPGIANPLSQAQLDANKPKIPKKAKG